MGQIPIAPQGFVDVFCFHESGAERRYLLLRRSPQERYPGIWQGVAGAIEAGETAVQAALRELREETGREPRELYALDHVSVYYLHVSNEFIHVPAFAAELDHPEIQLSAEHDQYEWLSLGEAVHLASWNPYREALKSIPELLSREAARALAKVPI